MNRQDSKKTIRIRIKVKSFKKTKMLKICHQKNIEIIAKYVNSLLKVRKKEIKNKDRKKIKVIVEITRVMLIQEK